MKPLKGNKKIEELFSSGEKRSSSSFVCKYLNKNIEEVFVVISVPKKLFSRAVDRNKIKRRIREVLRKNKDVVYKNGGGWYMFIFSSQKTLSFSEIEEELLSLFE
jgi:ribonuclease P protein component